MPWVAFLARTDVMVQAWKGSLVTAAWLQFVLQALSREADGECKTARRRIRRRPGKDKMYRRKKVIDSLWAFVRLAFFIPR